MSLKKGDVVLYKGIQRIVSEVDTDGNAVETDNVSLEGVEAEGWISADDVIKLPDNKSEDNENENKKEEDKSKVEIIEIPEFKPIDIYAEISRRLFELDSRQRRFWDEYYGSQFSSREEDK